MPGNLHDYDLTDATAYHYGHFPPEKLDYKKILTPLRIAASRISQYDTLLSNLHNKDLLLRPLKNQEAVVSSRMEGTVATLDEVLSYEAESDDLNLDESRKAKYRSEVMEVHSYTRALNKAQDMLNNGVPISGRVIRKAHEQMLFWSQGAKPQPGVFKTEQNYIVDRRKKSVLFIPISHDKLNVGFRELETYINSSNDDSLVKIALSHVEFEALHPFKDGNGRVGRMLITLMLWQSEFLVGPYFYVSGFFENNKDEYIDRMRAVSSHGEWTEWCMFFLEALATQAEQNIDTANQIMTLYEEMKEEFRKQLASQWTINAVDFMFQRPVFRNSRFTSTSGIPKQTAARFTKTLADHGFLKTMIPAAGSRSAVYAFEPLLQIVRK